MATTENGKELIDKAASIKNVTSLDINSQKNKAAMTGGFIGMAGGVYWGYAKKQNLLVCGIMGAIGGALISRLFMPKI